MNPRPPGPQPDALPTELHSPPSVSLSASAPAATAIPGRLLGAPEGIRTPDPRLRRPLLFPPELLARIGASRFERPTPCSQGRCATMLRYAPSPYRLTYARPPLNSISDFCEIRVPILALARILATWQLCQKKRHVIVIARKWRNHFSSRRDSIANCE